jgi:beta-glucosidase
MKMKRTWLILIIGLFVLSACRSAPTATPPPTQTPGSAAYLDPSLPVEDRVADLLSRMSLDEKIGQMTQAATDGLVPGDVERLFLGSVLSGGGGIPLENTLSGWMEMVQGYQ